MNILKSDTMAAFLDSTVIVALETVLISIPLHILFSFQAFFFSSEKI